MSDFEELTGLEEFGDLSEFSIEDLGGETIELAEDLEGFASGFPNWDLHPPKAEDLIPKKKTTKK